MRSHARYDEPFFWWGPRWEVPAPVPLRELLRDGTIDPWSAAHVWAALARRQSLAVVAGPSGSGKTTLLTALCELLPAETRRVYVRGCFEDFAFLRDSGIDPRQTALLVNELSPHLPVYLWGPGVAEVLRATRTGFMVLATAHATTAIEFVGTLAGSPLRLPPELIAAFGVVVAIGAGDSLAPRRVSGVWRLGGTREGVAIEPLPTPPRDPCRDTVEDRWFPGSEIAHRVRLLMIHADGNEPTLPVVRILPEENGSDGGDVAP
jgi:energy-coupling factor transporter ATP-binding protein EcfA2